MGMVVLEYLAAGSAKGKGSQRVVCVPRNRPLSTTQDLIRGDSRKICNNSVYFLHSASGRSEGVPLVRHRQFFGYLPGVWQISTGRELCLEIFFC